MTSILNAIGAKCRIENHHQAGKLVSTLTYRRAEPAKVGLMDQQVNEFAQPIFDSAKLLPEFLAYVESRDKGHGLEKEVARVGRELQKLDLDQAAAIADLAGKPLAVELSRIADQRTALNADLVQCEAGQTLFAAALLVKKALARDAVATHYVNSISALLTEVKARLQKAWAKLEAADELLAILDEVALAERFGERFRSVYSTSSFGGLSDAKKDQLFAKTLAPTPEPAKPAVEPIAQAEDYVLPRQDELDSPQPELDAPPKAKGKSNAKAKDLPAQAEPNSPPKDKPKGKVLVDVPAPPATVG